MPEGPYRPDFRFLAFALGFVALMAVLVGAMS